MADLIKITRAKRRVGRLAVLCVILGLLSVLGFPMVALADQWTDISDAQWQSVYKIKASDAYAVAQGYPDKTFRPSEPVTRGQFAKMSVLGLSIPTADPPTAHFSDVPKGSTFYQYVEGAFAAGIIGGYSNNRFGPYDNLLRQQAYSILGKHLSSFEIKAFGSIKDGANSYGTLAAWYSAKGASYLSSYADAGEIDAVHKPGAAYLVARQVVLGSQSGTKWYLQPQQTLNRAPAVALIVRTQAEVVEMGTPAIVSVTPTSGPATGGTQVTITGRGFVSVSQVKFGQIPASSFTVHSGTSITATAPASGVVGTIDISVVTSIGTSPDTPADNFTYLATPLITMLDPTTGPISGGNPVVIHGVNFVNVSQVKFGDATATFTVNNSMQITATAPAHAAGDATVQVTAGGGTSSPSLPTSVYRYGPTASVSSVQPSAGPASGGNLVTIAGSHLSGASQVNFGTQPGVIKTVSDATITVEAPAQVASGLPRDETVNVSVVTPFGTATLPASYMYLLPPTITDVQPGAGPLAGGQTVVISGYHLFHVDRVVVGSEDATVVSTAADGRSVTVTTPANNAGWASVSLYTAGGYFTLVDAYEYVPAPTISGLNPDSAPVGIATDVTITGTNLVDVSEVKFGNATCAVASVDRQTVRVTVPAAQAGGKVNVSLKAAGGQVTKEMFFTFTYTLSGVVKDAATNAAISGATVKVYQENRSTVVGETATAADGSYSFELAPGSYTVFSSRTGWADQWYYLKPGNATTVDVIPLNMDRVDINFLLNQMIG